MSYTAIESMRKHNLKRFGKNVGPFQPESLFRISTCADGAVRFFAR